MGYDRAGHSNKASPDVTRKPSDKSGPNKRDNRPSHSTIEKAASVNDGERIAKRLARAGIASRRDAEMMIASGRIAVNGQLITSPALNVKKTDIISVDGKKIAQAERTRLWLYHKPAGLVTTNRDPQGRPTVFSRLPADMPRVLSVGRLDINTEGLLLLTNDGGLARVLELPTTGWVRRYRVRAHGQITQEKLDSLKNGIAVDGVFYGAIEASIEREQGANVWLQIALREGKNREVKNILGSLGLAVNRLIRVSFGPFQLADLEEGAVRELKGRILRDQLGERLIEEANADFDAPILKPFSNSSVRAEKQPNQQNSQSSDWISSASRAGPRRKKIDTPENHRDRLSTRRDDFAAFSQRDERGHSDKRERAGQRNSFERRNERAMQKNDASGFKDDASTTRRDPWQPRSRSSNVWMAPGARPVKASKQRRDGDQPQRYESRDDGEKTRRQDTQHTNHADREQFGRQKPHSRGKTKPFAASPQHNNRDKPHNGRPRDKDARKGDGSDRAKTKFGARALGQDKASDGQKSFRQKPSRSDDFAEKGGVKTRNSARPPHDDARSKARNSQHGRPYGGDKGHNGAGGRAHSGARHAGGKHADRRR